MTHGVEHAGGWMPDAPLAWAILAVWLVVVVLYGLYRSTGEAPQDPIRPSGPFPEGL